jgi:hypothetical protein
VRALSELDIYRAGFDRRAAGAAGRVGAFAGWRMPLSERCYLPHLPPAATIHAVNHPGLPAAFLPSRPAK